MSERHSTHTSQNYEDDSKSEKRESRHKDHSKSRKKEKKRKREESSESEEISGSEQENKKRKREKKSKHSKKEKKHKKHKKHKKEKKEKKGKKGESKNQSDIGDDDYYAKGAEFRKWLLETKSAYLEDLETAEARILFREFAKCWNAHTLPSQYYSGSLPELDVAARTKYKWDFVKNVDREQMQSLRDEVLAATYKEVHEEKEQDQLNEPAPDPRNNRKVIGPQAGPPTALEAAMAKYASKPMEEEDDEDARAFAKWKDKKDFKDYKKHKEMVDEELVPKPTGKEAMRAKKKEKSAHTRKSKDADMDMELGDKDMYGGSDFQRLLQKQRSAQDRKKEARLTAHAAKMEEYNKKEAEKMAPFLAMVQMGQIPLLQQRDNK